MSCHLLGRVSHCSMHGLWRHEDLVGIVNLSGIQQGLPGGTSGKEPTCQCRRRKGHRFNPQVRKIP